MNPNDLITKLQSIVYVLRRGQMEKVLAALSVGLFGFAVYLRQEWKELPHAEHVVYVLLAACGLCAFWLFFRIWKQAAPPPPPPDVPMASAVKGLLPFTVADGSLFARLGRRTELQLLVSLAKDDQIGISVVRGQSGAGKTSLLQAGLAYTIGEDHCVYWEALRAKAPEALLHAIRSRFPSVASLESLPDASPNRCTLILDQFEQLSPNEPEHTPVFGLLALRTRLRHTNCQLLSASDASSQPTG